MRALQFLKRFFCLPMDAGLNERPLYPYNRIHQSGNPSNSEAARLETRFQETANKALKCASH